MRVNSLFFTAMCVWGCGKNADTETKPLSPSNGNKTESASDPDVKPTSASALKPASPDPRQKLLENEWNAYEDLEIAHLASGKSNAEKEMLRYLLEAGRIIDELYMLQIHPRNLMWRDTLAESGTDIERKVFLRNRMPWCEDNNNSNCTAIRGAGAREVGLIFWPKGFTETKLASLSHEINAKELFSPFTVVREKESGGYVAIPYAGFDLFSPKMKKAAAALKAAANSATDASLKKFLLSRADAFLSLNPFPFDDSDYDWIGLKGDWEVTVGPYEVYNSAFQTKALFEMIIGQEDKALTGSLAQLKGEMQGMEDALAVLVGETVYKPRVLDSRIAVRAVDVWAAFGDAHRSRGAIAAYHLPNRGKSVDEGLYKKVILVNHAKALESVSKARAALVLDPSQRGYLSFEDDITNTAFHELAHGFGAYHEMRITDVEGRLTTVKEALREYESLLEELKADTLGLWLSKVQNDNKTLDDEALKRRYVSSLVHMVGLLQYPLDDTYTQMVATALGRYMDEGAIVYNETSGQLTVVFEKMGNALSALVKETATIQLTGDFTSAKSLVEKYVVRGPSGYSLKGKGAAVRASVVEKFRASATKSPSLRYAVNGL